MIYNLKTNDVPEELDYHLCIVGGGPAGINIAKEFAGLKTKVLLVESGEFENTSEQENLLDGKGSTDFVEGYGNGYLQHSRLRFFGGASNHWGGMCRPLDEIDFENRDGIKNIGWPFSKSMLEPYYRKAEALLKLGSFKELENREYDWGSFEASNLPLKTPIFQFSALNFGEVFKEDIVNAENIDLIINANLTNIKLTSYNNHVEELVLKALNGNQIKVKPDLFVLACGGIENPRIMLNCNDDIENGIGNDHDLVGKYFMEHPHYPQSAQLLYAENEPLDDTPLYKIIDWIQDTEYATKRYLGLGEEVLKKEGLLNTGFDVIDTKDYDELGDENSTDLAIKHFSDKVWNKKEAPLNLTQTLFLRGEQLPKETNRVELIDRKDQLGLKRVHLVYKVSEEEIANYQRSLEWIAKGFGKQLRGRLRLDLSFDSDMVGGAHHMGTTRMHNNPRKGVVNEHCQVHGIKNFYIAGSSVFPSSGFANPTLTILALSFRLVDHLKAQLNHGK